VFFGSPSAGDRLPIRVAGRRLYARGATARDPL